MNNKIKVTIIGCGARGIEHAGAYASISDATIWALCDPNLERLKAFPGDIPTERRFADVASLLKNHVPELVHLITPPTVRLAVIKQMLEAGVKAFVIEKPFASSLAEARQIVALCQSHQARFVVNHQLPCMGTFRRSKRLLEDGVIGEIERVRISCNGSPAEQGTHMIDLAGVFLGGLRPQRLLGQIAGAKKLQAAHPSPEWMIGRILCEGGVPVDLVFGDIADPRVDPALFWVGCRLEIFGSKGMIDQSLARGYRIILHNGPMLVDTAYHWGTENDQAQRDFTREALDNFSGKHASLANSGEAALQPIAVLEGLMASAMNNTLENYPVEPIGDLAQSLKERLTK
ncbi:MAG: Gfo/Idh/MocA family oxidoreductase [Opitutaceae bacterium]|nr:Gfo/Idh/MocA family oxidoreductase [Opitutaceae bacterium]